MTGSEGHFRARAVAQRQAVDGIVSSSDRRVELLNRNRGRLVHCQGNRRSQITHVELCQESR